MASPENQTYVLREEYERVLGDLHKDSSSMLSTIDSKMRESQNIYLDRYLPSSDVALNSWAQPEPFGMLGNPIVPDDPMLSTSDPLAGLPDFETYETMP